MRTVDVNLLLNYHSAIFLIYQGYCRNFPFFVIYDKVLCKQRYVNLINRR